MTHRAFLGLGSNLGNPEKNILRAAGALERVPAISPVGLSSGYWTAPVGRTSQPRFLNAAMAVDTELEPGELLAAMLGIEAALGRRRTGPRWGPRVIDLDLLLMEDRILHTDRLTLPHPRLYERAFALAPLLELWPEARAPQSGERLCDLFDALDAGADDVGDPFPLPHRVARQEFDHTADVGFTVAGATQAELVEHTAMALVDLIVDRRQVVERERRVVECRESDRVDRLIGLLGEVVYLLDAGLFVPRRVTLLEQTDRTENLARLAVYGERLRDESRQIRTHVKAVTYHNASVERDRRSGRWSASIVVDV